MEKSIDCVTLIEQSNHDQEHVPKGNVSVVILIVNEIYSSLPCDPWPVYRIKVRILMPQQLFG